MTLPRDGTPTGPDEHAILHASCVVAQGRALLICGGSGCGKSTLALDLIGLGATLVSDDRTVIRRQADTLWASPPEPIAGRIEARHVGILRLPHAAQAQVVLAIDLEQTETDRLPPRREITILGLSFPLLYRPPGAGLPVSALFQCLLNRRETP